QEPASAEPAAELEPQPTAEEAPAEAPAERPAPSRPAAGDEDGHGERAFVSPVVARIAAEHGVDVGQVEGTGRGGRITKKDILTFIESGAPAPEEAAPVPAAQTPVPPAEAPPEPAPQPSEQPQPRAEPAPAPQPAPPQAPAPAPAPAPAARAEPQAGETVEPMTPM